MRKKVENSLQEQLEEVNRQMAELGKKRDSIYQQIQAEIAVLAKMLPTEKPAAAEMAGVKIPKAKTAPWYLCKFLQDHPEGASLEEIWYGAKKLGLPSKSKDKTNYTRSIIYQNKPLFRQVTKGQWTTTIHVD